MASAHVTVSGASGVKAALRRVVTGVEGEMRQAVEAEADAIVEDEQAAVPAPTGNLRDSIGWTRRGTGVVVGPGQASSERDPFYGWWVEFGRSSAAAQPFATPAAERSRARWPGRAVDHAKRGAEGAS